MIHLQELILAVKLCLLVARNGELVLKTCLCVIGVASRSILRSVFTVSAKLLGLDAGRLYCDQAINKIIRHFLKKLIIIKPILGGVF